MVQLLHDLRRAPRIWKHRRHGGLSDGRLFTGRAFPCPPSVLPLQSRVAPPTPSPHCVAFKVCVFATARRCSSTPMGPPPAMS